MKSKNTADNGFGDEGTESHTLAECNDWLLARTVMLCVVLVHIDYVNPSFQGTVIFLVKGVGSALKWNHLLLIDCLNVLKLKGTHLLSGSLWMMMMLIFLYWGC